MNCDRCEAFSHCEGYKLTKTINKKGCCFGSGDDWCAKGCPVGDLCRMRQKAPEAIWIIEEETDEL